ncbi:APC family permease [Pseudothauera rhizosphaerae]|uniref:APC family permease n=1 Tax=Pseudothauera rhizosphaerae TaxID=2565932 RepID=A0A4S4ADH0_9RHOO|nr:APC family permease [Pseudothauera rhizosphaerae]THF56233.1 APC family permease [Pseudothauera rhizosphaerae]
MLEKKISVLNGVAIAISMVVGSGLFGLPGLAIKATDPVTALIGWGVIILMMPTLIYVFSYLGQRYPSTDGVSLYASLGLGQWSKKGIMLVTCGTLVVGMPAFFLVGGSYIARLLELDLSSWATPCAIILAIITTAINVAGVDKLGWVNKSVVVVVLVTATLISVQSLPMAISQYSGIQAEAFDHVSAPGIWMAASIVFWAFQGWENLTFGFGEIENPKRNIPLIYWLSFFFVALIYGVFSAVVSAAALKGMDVASLAGVAGLLPNTLIGKTMLIVMVLILVANANSWVFGCSRAFYSAARTGVLPQRITKTNAKGIPANSLIYALIAYIAVIIVMWRFSISEQFCFLMTTQGFILLYGAAILAFMKLSSGFINRAIGLLAISCWSFLMHGFGWMIVYPFSLLLIGTVMDLRSQKQTGLTQSRTREI